ncbi:hypothetical protein GJAV_G00152660 [Gymnothorax javanicus]|nr:hypothetical protein GJAV_G00152660 [Gymnothorax javanicus]
MNRCSQGIYTGEDMASCKPNMDPGKEFSTSDEEEEESYCCKAESQSALRIVLVGVRWAGKSSVANIILGKEEFDTRVGTVHCVRRQGERAGRQLVVVDSSGWVWHSAQDATRRVEQEMASCVSLCHPGPHAILLVIPMGSSGKRYKRAARKHLELLSERVWNYIIVLFTMGDSTDYNIQKGGKTLQLLLEKCGTRHHILDIKNKETSTQVTELLEKIEEMVEKNGGSHYEIQNESMENSATRKKKVGWKMWRKHDKPDQISQDKGTQTDAEQEGAAMFPRDELSGYNLPELRMVLLGERGAGKSTVANTILGRQLFDTEKVTGECEKKTSKDGHRARCSKKVQVPTLSEICMVWSDYPHSTQYFGMICGKPCVCGRKLGLGERVLTSLGKSEDDRMGSLMLTVTLLVFACYVTQALKCHTNSTDSCQDSNPCGELDDVCIKIVFKKQSGNQVVRRCGHSNECEEVNSRFSPYMTQTCCDLDCCN